MCHIVSTRSAYVLFQRAEKMLKDRKKEMNERKQQIRLPESIGVHRQSGLESTVTHTHTDRMCVCVAPGENI